MDGDMARRIETGVDGGAAALLAAAVLFATFRLGLPLLLAAGWAVLAFVLSFRLLESVDGAPGRHAMRDFPLAAFPETPELLLDEPDSRVVRLFDPAAVPEQEPLLSADASNALYAAFAELRRSLR